MIVAIDGPSGAGKSSVSEAVAKQLGFSCLDTGAMYRAVAWRALHDGISLDDSSALTQLAQEAQIEFIHSDDNPLPTGILIDGVDVTGFIRCLEIDRAVSPVSAEPGVRAALVVQQQRIGRSGNYVVEGRDIGTTVFPDADIKIFLTATDSERASRRLKQNEERGSKPDDYDEVLADIRRRDAVDSSRETSPLAPAKDALLLDSTSMSFNEVVTMISSLAQERLA